MLKTLKNGHNAPKTKKITEIPQNLQNDLKIIHEFHKNLFMTKLTGLFFAYSIIVKL